MVLSGVRDANFAGKFRKLRVIPSNEQHQNFDLIKEENSGVNHGAGEKAMMRDKGIIFYFFLHFFVRLLYFFFFFFFSHVLHRIFVICQDQRR